MYAAADGEVGEVLLVRHDSWSPTGTATSRTGAHLLAEAARRGYEVAASTRRPGALPAGVPLERMVTGDGRDPRVVAEVIADADAVFTIVNGGDRADPHCAEEALRTAPDGSNAESTTKALAARWLVSDTWRATPARLYSTMLLSDLSAPSTASAASTVWNCVGGIDTGCAPMEASQ